MLASKTFTFTAGVFIGEMKGILDEFQTFERKWQKARTLPVASTGGAARILWEKGAGSPDVQTRELLATSKRYRGLFRSLLGGA